MAPLSDLWFQRNVFFCGFMESLRKSSIFLIRCFIWFFYQERLVSVCEGNLNVICSSLFKRNCFQSCGGILVDFLLFALRLRLKVLGYYPVIKEGTICFSSCDC